MTVELRGAVLFHTLGPMLTSLCDGFGGTPSVLTGSGAIATNRVDGTTSGQRVATTRMPNATFRKMGYDHPARPCRFTMACTHTGT